MTRPDETETAEQAMQRLRQEIQVRSARIAVEALTEVAADRKAPAPARATAGTSLLRAAGFFAPGQDGREKAPHEMSPSELEAAVQRARRELAAAEQRRSAGDEQQDIFG